MHSTHQIDQRERGAVLLTSLLLLLMITIVGASVMQTSNFEVKMASAKEMKEIAFQTAEAVLEESIADINYFGEAFSAKLVSPSTPSWPSRSYNYAGYNTENRAVNAAGSSELRYLTNAASLGYSIRKGSAGLETYFYEVEAQSSVAGTHVRNTHIQGVYVDAPRIN